MREVKRLWCAALMLAAACEAARPAEPSATNTEGGAPRSSERTSDATERTSDATSREGPYATSQRGTLLWKRHAALEADLMAALALERGALCKELGERDCIRDVHVIALGGNDPFGSGINRPASQPLSTTPLVVDRVLLSACSARVRADKEKRPEVFSELDLKGPAPSPKDPAVEATIRELFQRFLARDPTRDEARTVATLLDPDENDAARSAEEFALLACFTIGSSLEFLFQ